MAAVNNLSPNQFIAGAHGYDPEEYDEAQAYNVEFGKQMTASKSYKVGHSIIHGVMSRITKYNGGAT